MRRDISILCILYSLCVAGSRSKLYWPRGTESTFEPTSRSEYFSHGCDDSAGYANCRDIDLPEGVTMDLRPQYPTNADFNIPYGSVTMYLQVVDSSGNYYLHATSQYLGDTVIATMLNGNGDEVLIGAAYPHRQPHEFDHINTEYSDPTGQLYFGKAEFRLKYQFDTDRDAYSGTNNNGKF